MVIRSIVRRVVSSTIRFRSEEAGGLTIFGLYLIATMAVIGGIAIDMAHLIAQRTKLQATADMTAHAALYSRDAMSEEDALIEALQLVLSTMPADSYGTVVTESDIVFGRWDYSADAFQADTGSREAAMVTLTRQANKGNAVGSFLMQFVGLDQWDLTSQAVFVTYRPACLREGFVAQDVVDLRSNNGFSNGFCIHSNTHVSLNSNNFFEAGTVVSMPDLEELDLPNSGFETNEGLETALREGRMNIRILNQIDDIYAGLFDINSEHMPTYITDWEVYELPGKTFTATDFTPGRIYYFDCNGKLTFNPTDGAFREIVIIATCPVQFGQNVILEDVVMMTTDTSAQSFKAASSLQVGRDDNCAPGGGAQLLTYGGMSFPSDLRLYGGQLIALGNIEFAANADGIQGASIISGQEISGTSNMEMAFCGTGMENNFEAEYFRLAR